MIYDEIPGGADLVLWLGQIPSFHDAEIISLHLNRCGRSSLRLHGWIHTGKVGNDGYLELGKQAIVTFDLENIMDLQLDGFSVQNVISGLVIRRAPDRPDRRPYLAGEPSSQDIEIELEPCYGLSGFIRARSVTVTFAPGKPDDDIAARNALTE